MVTDCSLLYESEFPSVRCAHPVARGIHLCDVCETSFKIIDLAVYEILANPLRGLRGERTNSSVVNRCLLI
jgi:hypothetical protein